MVFFDVSMAQIAVVFLVGAATLGPRDLPRAARSCGYLMGRASRYLRDSASTANQLMREAEIPELKQDIRQSMKDMERIRSQIHAATRINVNPFGSSGAASSDPPSESEPGMTPARPPSTGFAAGGLGGVPAASAGPEGGSSNPLERELEEQLRTYDATKPRDGPKGKAKRTVTEAMASGADVVVECLRQQRFNRDCRRLIKEQKVPGLDPAAEDGAAR